MLVSSTATPSLCLKFPERLPPEEARRNPSLLRAASFYTN
jgi:hypothetical protein